MNRVDPAGAAARHLELFLGRRGMSHYKEVCPMLPKRALTMTKWPFWVGDLILLALAWWIMNRNPGDPFAMWPLLCIVACVAAGAWICVLPYLAEFRSASRLAESESLQSVVQQMGDLKSLAKSIAGATSQWQDVQDKATQAATSARDIAERMTVEAQAFAEFMRKSNDTEKAHLRLEVDKLHRAEGEWLQVLTLLLDHVHALHQAAVRSGKTGLITQLTGFQRACRDTARRVGLVPVDVPAGTPFNEEEHQLVEEAGAEADTTALAPNERRVAETLATGVTYQGRRVRKALVRLEATQSPPPPAAPQEVDLFEITSAGRAESAASPSAEVAEPLPDSSV